jgi:hypothetical protein
VGPGGRGEKSKNKQLVQGAGAISPLMRQNDFARCPHQQINNIKYSCCVSSIAFRGEAMPGIFRRERTRISKQRKTMPKGYSEIPFDPALLDGGLGDENLAQSRDARTIAEFANTDSELSLDVDLTDDVTCSPETPPVLS